MRAVIQHSDQLFSVMASAAEDSCQSSVGVRSAAELDRSAKCDLRAVWVTFNRIKENPSAPYAPEASGASSTACS